MLDVVLCFEKEEASRNQILFSCFSTLKSTLKLSFFMELIMKVHELKMNMNENVITDDELEIPIDISDILAVCKEYNKLGLKIQYQVENLLELGIDEAIRTGIVKVESLPHIKGFLNSICDNAYFGDAVDQANECIALIEHFEMRSPSFASMKN